VFTLPLLIFIRAYPIYYLQQFSPRYVIVVEPAPPGYGFPVVQLPGQYPPGQYPGQDPGQYPNAPYTPPVGPAAPPPAPPGV
jgi:hypothetical protein